MAHFLNIIRALNGSLSDYQTQKAAAQCELLVWLTPVTFGGYSSQLKAAVDRIIPNVLPYLETIKGETHHSPRYRHYANLLVIGLQETTHEPSAQLFRQLVARNAINRHSPLHAAGVIHGAQSPEIPSLVASMLTKVGVRG